MAILGVLVLGATVQAADAADAGAGTPASTQPGDWKAQKLNFFFMGFTATYSCDGLGDQLRVLLRASGARDGAKIDPICARGFGVPDKLAQANLEFSTLQPQTGPTPAAPTVPGTWRHVSFSPHHPYELQLGDCELIEQFRDKLLPKFTTRNVQSQVTCVPNQLSGSNYNLSFEVFAPAAPAVAASP
jgi:hypothetical protein